MDSFVHYLVVNQIRTSQPNQPEVKCTAPEKYAGVPLKELMIKKANETLAASIQRLGLDGNAQKQKNFLTNLFPGLANLGSIQVVECKKYFDQLESSFLLYLQNSNGYCLGSWGSASKQCRWHSSFWFIISSYTCVTQYAWDEFYSK